jgi:glutathione S-transferase
VKALTLFQPANRPWRSVNLSPFCAKLETYLRITGTEHALAPMARGAAPKGKVPYVDLGDGTLMGDSQLIIAELERRRTAAGKPALDAGLAPRDAAVGHAMRRMLEEGFYYVMLHQRWTPEDHYEVMRAEFKKFAPGFVLPLVRRDIKKRVHGQGTGRHELAESADFGAADLDAVADLLGDQPFLFGDAPRVADCVAFAFVESILAFPLESPLRQRAAARANLVAYRARIRTRWYPDLEPAA